MAKTEGKSSETPLLVKLILGLAIIGLLFFLANTLIYKKIDDEIAALTTEREQLDKKVQEGQGFLRTENEHMRDIAILSDQLSAQSRCLPDGSEIDQLAKEFYKDAQEKYDMFDVSFDISGISVNERKLQEIPIAFRCSATFTKLGELFQAVSRYSRILNIESLDLKRLSAKERASVPGWKKTAQLPTIKVAFVAKTYSMVKDPDEDSQIQEVIAKARQTMPTTPGAPGQPAGAPPAAGTPAAPGAVKPAPGAPGEATEVQINDYRSVAFVGAGKPDPFFDPIEAMQDAIAKAKEKEMKEKVERIAVIPPLNVRWKNFKGFRAFLLSEVTFNGVLENKDGSKAAIFIGPDRHAHNVKKGDFFYNAYVSNITRVGSEYRVIVEEYELRPNSSLIDRIEGKKMVPVTLSQAVDQVRGSNDYKTVKVSVKTLARATKPAK